MFLDACTKTVPKAMDVHVCFQKNRLWLTDGKVFAVVWFSAKASFQGHREPPCCHTAKGEHFPRPHAHSVETLRTHSGEQGGFAPSSRKKVSVLFSDVCFSATETALFGDATCSHMRGPLLSCRIQSGQKPTNLSVLDTRDLNQKEVGKWPSNIQPVLSPKHLHPQPKRPLRKPLLVISIP